MTNENKEPVFPCKNLDSQITDNGMKLQNPDNDKEFIISDKNILDIKKRK